MDNTHSPARQDSPLEPLAHPQGNKQDPASQTRSRNVHFIASESTDNGPQHSTPAVPQPPAFQPPVMQQGSPWQQIASTEQASPWQQTASTEQASPWQQIAPQQSSPWQQTAPTQQASPWQQPSAPVQTWQQPFAPPQPWQQPSSQQQPPWQQPSAQPSPWQPNSTDVFSKLSLPKLEPESFKGDLLQFPEWIKSFESLIENSTESTTQRLYFLSKYTDGDARDCIKGFLVQDNENAYSEAKQTLIRRYGDKYRLAEAFKCRINGWPAVKNGEDLQKLSDFLNQCCSAMNSIAYLKCLDSSEENKKIISKLPRHVASRWIRKVDKSLYETDGHDGSYPSFSEFCKFLQDEARIETGPVSLSFSLNADTKNYTKGRIAKTFASQVTPSSSTPDSTKPDSNSKTPVSKSTSCFMCQESHELQNCERFKALDIDDRKSLAKSKGL